MSKLNFAIALKMTTDQFKKGVGVVKSGIKQLQYQAIGMASALGLGGIGLSNLASRFIDVARETTRARVALRNISGDAGGFKKNMDFLMGSSNRWGQELNAMTAEFSKFSAAASSAGISIQDQHSIFESFTRSITAFGMKSEDAHLAYLALSQMMSKGKISSEELRRQLGERMPVAMEAMARAVGVTIQELDGLLKAGKLVSKDVMLPFVKEMEKMLPEVNTDNIETSVNRLKNTFTKLTQDLKIGEFYKKIVDGANKMLAGIQTSFARIAAVIISSIASAKVFAAFRSLYSKNKEINEKILSEKIRTEKQVELAKAKRVAAEARYEEMSRLYSKATNEQQLAYYSKMKSAESAMDKARLREKAAFTAFETAQAVKTTNIWSTAWNNIKKTAVSAFAAIKVAISSIAIMAVIGAITNFVMKLVEARKEAKRISNIFSDYQKELQNVSGGAEAAKLTSLLKIVNERFTSQKKINEAQSELERMLEVEKGSQVDLNELVAKRISLLKEAARADLYSQKIASTEEKNTSILGEVRLTENQIGEVEKARRTYNFNVGAGNNEKEEWKEYYKKVKDIAGIKGGVLKSVKRFKEIDSAVGEYHNNLNVIADASKNLGNAITNSTESVKDPIIPKGDDSGSDKKEKESPLEKAEKEYAETLQKLKNQKEAGVLKTSDYNKSIDDLNKATYEEIGGILGANAERNATFQKAKQGVENQLLATNELKEVEDEYNKNLKELNNKKRVGLISEEKYNEELSNLVDSTSDKITSFDKIGKAEEEYINNLKQIKSGLIGKPEKESRDTTFDYKKSRADKLSDEVSLQKEYVNKIQELKDGYKLLGEYGKQALSEIAEEEKKLTSLSDALKLAQIKEDIKNMRLDIFSESIDGITGFANALDRIANSWQRVSETLEDTDTSGFERLVSVINAAGDSIKGLIGVWESYKTVQELINQLSSARSSLSTAEAASEVTKIGSIADAQVAADIATATSAGTRAVATVGAFTAEEIAARGVMAAGAAAAYAAIPVLGPTLAAGQITAMEGLIAGSKIASLIPGFYDGGIVNSIFKTGDKNLVRVNGGEMITTTAQQSKLWNAIEKGNFGRGLGGEIKVRIEGKDLVGTLNQFNKYKSRV